MYYRLQREYRIGDVVLFSQEGETRVGRIVATDGDTVNMNHAGKLIVNGGVQSEEIFTPLMRMTRKLNFPIPWRTIACSCCAISAPTELTAVRTDQCHWRNLTVRLLPFSVAAGFSIGGLRYNLKAAWLAQAENKSNQKEKEQKMKRLAKRLLSTVAALTVAVTAMAMPASAADYAPITGAGEIPVTKEWVWPNLSDVPRVLSRL